MRLRSALVNELGIFASNLGDLSRARAAFAHSQLLDAGATDEESESVDSQNLAGVELLAGRFLQATEHAERALALAAWAGDQRTMLFAAFYRTASRLALGDVSAAVDDFQRATELERKPLYGLRGIWEAECKLLRGDRTGALRQTRGNREICVQYDKNADLCRCNALLARLLIPDDPAQAAKHLQDARAFADRSGVVEFQLRCLHAACELQRHLGDHPQSIAEGEAGILLADTCGFGKCSIDLRLALAETYLAAGDARQALQNARNALDRSELPDCQYA